MARARLAETSLFRRRASRRRTFAQGRAEKAETGLSRLMAKPYIGPGCQYYTV